MTSRGDFRDACVSRDSGECVIPWCHEPVTVDPDGPGEVHHIIERELWDDGGYFADNGSCVCNYHHRLAENNLIPPQAFWRWLDIRDVTIPVDGVPTVVPAEALGTDKAAQTLAIDKWGKPFDAPSWKQHRENIKYPSTRHMLPLYWQSPNGTAASRTERDDTGFEDIDHFIDMPLAVMIKMDGSNAMLVRDYDEPVRARNGKHADHESFDMLKHEYWERDVFDAIPEHIQVFGENMYAKHSIHYGCPFDGCNGCEDRAASVQDVFLVFGAYDTRYDLWLSWPEVFNLSREIGFEMAPTVRTDVSFESIQDLKSLQTMADDLIESGHEGIIVRSFYPFHYGQFDRLLGKYVRPNHVTTDDHWMHRPTIRNKV